MVTLGYAVYVEAANAPIWDDWLKLFTTVQHTVEGRPWFEDIYQQYGPARYAGTQIVTALSVWLTGWNLRVLVWFHYALVIVSFGLVLDIYRRSYPSLVMLAAVPFAFLLFSLRQRGSLLWSFQGYVYYVVVLFLAALWLLTWRRTGWLPLMGALLLGVGAIFTYPTGWIVPPILLLGLWFWGYRRWTHYAFWVAGSVVSYGVYFRGYAFRERDVSGESLGSLVTFFVKFMGNPILTGTPMRTWFGFVVFGISGVIFIVALVTIWRRERTLEQLAAVLSWALFAVGASLLTTQGRAGRSPGNNMAFDSRYVFNATYYWVAWISVMIPAIRYSLQTQRWRERWVAVVCLVAIVPYGWLFVNASQWQTSRGSYPTRDYHERQMLAFQLREPSNYTHSDFVSQFFSSTDYRNTLFTYMMDNNLGIYRRPRQMIPLYDIPLRQIGGANNALFQQDFANDDLTTGGMVQFAPSVAEQRVFVPDMAGVGFETSAFFVFSRDWDLQAGQGRDGVNFYLSVVGDRGSEQIYTVGYHPDEDFPDEKPVSLDLSAYRGQMITIRYETKPRENSHFDQSAWVEPQIILDKNRPIEQDLGSWERIVPGSAALPPQVAVPSALMLEEPPLNEADTQPGAPAG